MNDNNGGNFKFSYSAAERAEVERIRNRYLPKEDNKLEQLRKLDRSASKKSTMYSIFFGVVGALLLGLGLCCTILWGKIVLVFVVGIVVGVGGIIVLSLAYPVYIYVEKTERGRVAPEIIRLTDELLK